MLMVTPFFPLPVALNFSTHGRKYSDFFLHMVKCHSSIDLLISQKVFLRYGFSSRDILYVLRYWTWCSSNMHCCVFHCLFSFSAFILRLFILLFSSVRTFLSLLIAWRIICTGRNSFCCSIWLLSFYSSIFFNLVTCFCGVQNIISCYGCVVIVTQYFSYAGRKLTLTRTHSYNSKIS